MDEKVVLREIPVLNTRLQAIGELIKPGRPIADIGSDHAQLPLYLVQNGVVPWAVASELGDRPYNRMCAIVDSTPCREQVIVRHGDGLDVLEASEVDGVIIAGMGGDVITSILSRDCKKAETFSYYLLQPMSKPGVLRRALAARGWSLIDERLVYERGQFYVIIQSNPGREAYSLSTLEEELGPLIIKGASPLKHDYLGHMLGIYRRVYNSLLNSKQEYAGSRRRELKANIEELEVILDASPG